MSDESESITLFGGEWIDDWVLEVYVLPPTWWPK